jgi:hypothetical protein
MTKEEFVTRIWVDDRHRIRIAAPQNLPLSDWARKDPPDLSLIESQLQDPEDIAWWRRMVEKPVLGTHEQSPN